MSGSISGLKKNVPIIFHREKENQSTESKDSHKSSVGLTFSFKSEHFFKLQ